MDAQFKEIMSLSPEERKIEQVQLIVDKLSNIRFLNELKESHGREAVKECCSQFTLHSFEPKENIITYRKVGEEFFIILEGSAKIYVPLEFEMTGTKEEIFDYKNKNDTLLIPSSDPNVKNCDFYETLDYDGETKIGKFKIRLLNMINKIEKGASFGELALINNKPRAATIQAFTSVTCAVLTRKNYESIIKPIEERILNEKIGFLKSFPFLQHLSKQTLSRLTYTIDEYRYNRGNTVYNEGDKSKGVYLIYKGEFQIYKRLDILKNKKYQKLGCYAKNIVKREDIPLVTALKGQYFGANETMKKPHICEYTVKCISPEGILWFLSQKYIIDESSLLTKRRMRESGQLLKDLYVKREEEATDVTQIINKPTVNKAQKEEEDEKSNKIREILKMAMTRKYPKSLPENMKDMLYDLETGKKEDQKILKKADQMNQKFNLILKIEENLKSINHVGKIPSQKIDQEKSKVFSLTKVESSPNIIFKNKSPENVNDIADEIAQIKSSIVEEKKKRIEIEGKLKEERSRNEIEIKKTRTGSKLLKDGKLPSIYKRSAIRSNDAYRSSGRATRDNKDLKMVQTQGPEWVNIEQGEQTIGFTTRNLSSPKFDADNIEKNIAYEHYMLKTRYLQKPNNGFKTAREVISKIENQSRINSIRSKSRNADSSVQMMSPKFNRKTPKAKNSSPPEVSIKNMPDKGPLLQSRRLLYMTMMNSKSSFQKTQ
ncbi:unnamed protein product [Moneuplotes crassus]|uniref:Cyclic nucleotide-binding domain-containing protein n=1 Tax=Euplotes crassus TaxID=5936 RepID=A0AAD1Y9P3_EUPCR|nr:unnamed protein product [Moneuplotes crassus]